MMKKLELQPASKKNQKKPNKGDAATAKKDFHMLRFVTRATGVHGMTYSALIYAFMEGKDALTAVGYASAVIALLAIPACMICPDMVLGGAPLAPMLPMPLIFGYIAWRLLLSK